MNFSKRVLSIFLTAVMLLGISPFGIVPAYAATGSEDGATATVQNSYIKAVVDKRTGRFSITTVNGQPTRSKDNNTRMTFSGNDTSFTTFRINGTDYIFGNEYDLGIANYIASTPISTTVAEEEITNADNTKQKTGNWIISSTWEVEGIEITQNIEVFSDEETITDKSKAGMVLIDYVAKNKNGSPADVDVRLLLDTMLGNNDGPAYQNGVNQDNVHKTEQVFYNRELKEGDVVDTCAKDADGNPVLDTLEGAEVEKYRMQNYFLMRDSGSATNPLSTNIYAYGYYNVAHSEDDPETNRVIVGHWAHLSNTKFDVDVNQNLDYTTDTNDYGTVDTAIACYWDDSQYRTIEAGGERHYQIFYGLGELVTENQSLNVTFPNQTSVIGTNDAQTAYLNDGVFQIDVHVQVPEDSATEHSQIICELTLENGLDFVKAEGGNIVRENGKPVITDDGRSRIMSSQKQGGSYKQGDACDFRFYVMATGRPWPTTREYMVEVYSPEMTPSGDTKDSMKELWSVVRSDFVLLPSIGTLNPTTSFSLTPEEAYRTDEKLITVGITNVEAYVPKKGNTPANFTAYLVNEDDPSQMYQVKDESVSINSKDGATGTMTINYKGGILVSPSGTVIDAEKYYNDPTLPDGSYHVQVVYTGSSDPEENELLSFRTEQTMVVTLNNTTRVRTGGYLVVAKRFRNLTAAESAKYEDFLITLKPGPSTMQKILKGSIFATGDMKFDRTDLTIPYRHQKNRIPYYEIKLFQTEAQIDAYRREINELTVAEQTEINKKDAEYLQHEGKYSYDEDPIARTVYDNSEDWDHGEVLVLIKGMCKSQGSGDSTQYYVDTSTEHAIINNVAVYEGENLTISRITDMMAEGGSLHGYENQQYVRNDTLIKFGTKLSDSLTLGEVTVRGEGKVYLESSGFVFQDSVWTLDFFDGFDKSLWRQLRGTYEPKEYLKTEISPSNDSVKLHDNGIVADQENKLSFMADPDVYFNRRGLSQKRSFYDHGLNYKVTEYVLSSYNGNSLIRMAGEMNIVVFNAYLENLSFDSKGMWALDSTTGLNILNAIGCLTPAPSVGSMLGGFGPSGWFSMRRYRDAGLSDYYYGTANVAIFVIPDIRAEFGLKEVADGRLLPDVIGVDITFSYPGYSVAPPAVFLRNVHGMISGLADTIAKTGKDAIPLTLQAGAEVKVGEVPFFLSGNVDATLKFTGIRIEGKLDFVFAPKLPAETGYDNLLAKAYEKTLGGTTRELIKLPLLTEAIVEVQWCSPWFVNVSATADIANLHVLTGSFRLFIGQNKTGGVDFEGFASLGVMIPESVPVVGGVSLFKVYFGISNTKIWAGVPFGIMPIFITINVSYEWGGGLDIWVDDDGRPEDGSFCYLLFTDEETGVQSLMGIGNNMKMLASSRYGGDEEMQDITYRDLGGGVQLLEFRGNTVGSSGIPVTFVDGKWVHAVPLSEVEAGCDALIQVESYEQGKPLDGVSVKLNGTDYALQETGFTNASAVTNSVAANTLTYFVREEKDAEGATRNRAYIVVPGSLATGTAELSCANSIDTALISIAPTGDFDTKGAEIKNSTGTGNNMSFDAVANVKNVKAGDVVSFYLTKDNTTNGMNPASDIVIDPNGGSLVDADGKPLNGVAVDDSDMPDPGKLIYTYTLTDADVTNGTATVTSHVSSTQDYTYVDDDGVEQTKPLNEVLEGGTYYLRADLKTDSTFRSALAQSSVVFVDPKAPTGIVPSVALNPAGDGYFNVSFNAVQDANAYIIDFFDEDGKSYSPMSEVMVTPEGDETSFTVALGGWTDQISYQQKRDADGRGLYKDENGQETTVETEEVVYEEVTKKVGLEPGHEYTARVRPVNLVEKDTVNESYHFGSETRSAKKLLPEAAPATLTISGAKLADNGAYYELTTNADSLKLQVNVDKACTLQVTNGGDTVIDSQPLTAGNNEVDLSAFAQNDGEYALVFLTEVTGSAPHDHSSTVLHLKADHVAPFLYIDTPKPGDSIENGQIIVTGQTTGGGDSTVTVYVGESTRGTKMTVNNEGGDKEGSFSGRVQISTKTPKTKLTIVASDTAGNTNTAEIEVNNPGYSVAQGIVIRLPNAMQPDKTAQLETVVRYANGKDDDGNLKYREVKLDNNDENLTYEVTRGDAAEVDSKGNVKAHTLGASLVKAQYKTEIGQTLEAVTVVRVEDSSNSNNNNNNSSSNNSGTGGNGGGGGGGGGGAATGGGAAGGAATGGGAAGGGAATGGGAAGGAAADAGQETAIAATESQTSVNGSAASVTKSADDIVTIEGKAENGKIEVVSRLDADGYQVTYDNADAELAVDTPLVKMTVPAGELGESGVVTVKESESLPQTSGATALYAVDLNLGDSGDLRESVPVSIALPADIQISDVTAVMLKDENGNVTPLPWQLNMIGDLAYIEAVVTDEGTIIFESVKPAFSDVTTDDWAYADIMASAERGVINGMPDGTFDRTSNCTRSAFAAIVMRTSGLMTRETNTVLPDVNKNDWDYQALAVAKDIGVMTGFEDGTMRGGNPVSRVEAMTMVGRLITMLGIAQPLTESEVEEQLALFPDGKDIPDWARANVALCVKSGVIKGTDGMLSGSTILTREQCASISNRMDRLIVNALLGTQTRS